MLWVVLTFLFFFFRLLPGSFLDIMTFQGAGPDTIARLREKWGLNDPLYIQYGRYMFNMLNGDAGISLQYRQPVWEYVHMRILNSFVLIAPAITFSYLLGSLIGAVMGTNRGSFFEKYGLIPIIFAGSFPSFFVAILLIIVFAGWLSIFPTSGMVGIGQSFDVWWEAYVSKAFAMHYVLPFTAVVFRYLFLPVLTMRTSVVETMGQDFSFYHRMTGLPKLLRLRHTMKHSSLPVITLYPVSMTRAIGGLVLIETVFNWPGIGFTLVQAVIFRDIPVVQFVFFLVAAFVILANFGVDILYGIIDPRVSLGDE
jgi:peptide/nickel transport system permease protein